MRLKVKNVNLSTGRTLVVSFNKEDADKLDLHAGDRVRINRLKKDIEVIAVANIDFSEHRGIQKGEIGLYQEVMDKLEIEDGTHVEINLSSKPKSISYIRKKLDGKELSEDEINEIVKDIVDNKFSDIELTYFASGCYCNDLTKKEITALTNAIVESGKKINPNSKIVIDKHCIGGVANNRTTLLVVPIIAALGYKMPKTSSRAITSPSGTADTMEVIAPVTMGEEKILNVIKKTNACMIWGGAMNLAAADDYLIQVRHPLHIDPKGMLLASILAKKKAVGATHVLIDIPYGYGSKVPTKKEANKFAKEFTRIGKLLGMKIKVMITDGSQPIGRGIGPALEIADILNILNGNGPEDLRNKSIKISTEILKMLKVKNAKNKVMEVLNSGKAVEKFKEIVEAQGGRKNIVLPKAKYTYDYVSKIDGKVKLINNKGISKIARFAGAPKDNAAGLYLRVRKDETVEAGQILFTLHSDSRFKLNTALEAMENFEHIVICKK